MPRIDPRVMLHRLNVDPNFHPVKQKRRGMAPERQQVIQEKVGKLLNAQSIREVQYPDWLANIVLVKKSNNKWRLCVDISNLNKACPKDCYPLPGIQYPVYYISQVLQGPESRYARIEKLVFSLVTSSRRLCPYF